MSEIRTNLLKSERGDASPSAPFGLRVSGVTTTGTLTVSGDATIGGNLGVAGTITYEDVARVDATGISTFREGFGVGPLAGIALTAYSDGSIRTSGIVTASSFVGDSLSVTGNVTATTDLLLGGDITHIGDTNTRIKFAANDTVTVQTDGAERFRIDATGNTHLGNWSNQGTVYGKARVNIRGADEIATSFNLANSYLHIGGQESTMNGLYPISFGHTKADSTKASSYIGAKVTDSGAYEKTALVFATRDSTSDGAPTERLRIAATGAFGLSGTNYGTSGQVLKSGGSGAAPTWGVAGRVLQVKMASTATKIDTTTANTDCITCSITPTATTSNVLVMTTFFYGGNMNPNGGFRFTRGGTVLEGSGSPSQYGGAVGTFWSWDDCAGNEHVMEAASFNWLDTGPSGNGVNTTSAVDYKLEAHSFSRLLFNRGQTSGEARSTLILMEISA